MSFGYQVLGFGSSANQFIGITASGGAKTTSGDYTIHTFNSSGTFTISAGEGDVEYLVVAGAGGGAGSAGGGGPAGCGGALYAQPLHWVFFPCRTQAHCGHSRP